MSSHLLLLLILSLSIHSCSGRRLSDWSRSIQQMGKDFSDPVKPTQSLAGEQSCLGCFRPSVTVNKPKGSATREMVSGSEVRMLSSSPILGQTTKLEVGSGKRVRSLIGHGSSEETIGSKERSVIPDLVTMDYQIPQRGPSIHNK